MIDIELIRRDPEAVQRAVAARQLTDVDVDDLVRADEAWRAQTTELERLRRQHRMESTQVSALGGTERTGRISELRGSSVAVQKAEEKLRALAEQRETLWKRLPNLPLPTVPVGRDASENIVREEPEKLPEYAFTPRDHLDVGTALGILDVERATAASGTRFGALIGDGALLEFALIRHALDVLIPEGFLPIVPPVLIQREGMDAMGYLERGADEVYLTQDDLMLVGTSEQAVGAMHAGHTFADADLPARFVAFSSCFRREAGSHGKDVRGIIRLHQFDKVEMFSFCRPEESAHEQAVFLSYQKRLMDDLGLHYRIVDLCAGDLGFAAAATTDVETWFPARRAFVETHSTSNTTDFQTRRLRTKVRMPDGATSLVHAVNGTAYAIQRTIAAMLENFQQADGRVRVPTVLQAALGGREFLGERS